jgi:GH35 family endo-1,4-beta-xylanase
MPFQRALRVTTLRQPAAPWSIQVGTAVEGEIRQDDVCLLSIYVRCLRSQDESGAGQANLVVQQGHRPWRKLVTHPAAPGPEWQRVDVPFRAGMPLPRGRGAVRFQIGYRPQTLEFGGLRLLNYGPEAELDSLPRTRLSYPGREPGAPWRAEARERIERIRKAEITVTVTDAAGRPVEGAEVAVKMKRHAFGFGAAVKARMICADTEDGRRYREAIERHYNKVVFENDLKPRFWELGRSNEHRSWRREWTDQAIAWLRERDIEIRGHYMIWGPLDERAEQYAGRPDQLRADTFADVRERVGAVGEHIGEWDVINHIVGWGTTFEDFFGGPDIYVETMELAREIAPDAELWVNEGQVLPGGARRDSYAQVVRYLIEHGAAPEGVGFMGHFSAGSLTPPASLRDIFDRYAALVPRLQLTEFDVDVTDEELQADYLRDIMIAAFSHPQMEAVVMWGFWRGAIWKPSTALVRRDWSLKPAGRAWRDLVFDECWTDETGRTGADGAFATRGFLGDYAVEAAHDGRRAAAGFSLAAEGAEVRLTLE